MTEKWKCEECEQVIDESDIVLGDSHQIEVGEGADADVEICGPVIFGELDYVDDVEEVEECS